MPKKPATHRHDDFALLEQRYMKFLKIATLPRNQQEEAIKALLDEAKANSGQHERLQDTAPGESESVAGNEEQEVRLEDFFTDVTESKQGIGYTLPEPSSETCTQFSIEFVPSTTSEVLFDLIQRKAG